MYILFTLVMTFHFRDFSTTLAHHLQSIGAGGPWNCKRHTQVVTLRHSNFMTFLIPFQRCIWGDVNQLTGATNVQLEIGENVAFLNSVGLVHPFARSLKD